MKIRNIVKSFMLLGAIAGASSVLAADIMTKGVPLAEEVKVAEEGSKYPGILGGLSARGIKVDREFLVSPDIRGFVLDNNGQKTIVYAAGDYAFSGIIFSPTGVNLTVEHTEDYIPKPSMKETVSDIEDRGSYAQEGAEEGKPVVYIFSDPNCGHCKNLYKQTREIVKNKDLTLRWVEVGFLQNSQAPTSRDKAAYILSAEDPAKAKMEMELGYSPDGVTTKDYRAVGINQEIMQKAGINGTPSLIYYDGKTWVQGHSMPNERLLEKAKLQSPFEEVAAPSK